MIFGLESMLPEPYRGILALTDTQPQAALAQATALEERAATPQERALAGYVVGCCLLAAENYGAAGAQLARVADWFETAPVEWRLLYRCACAYQRQMTDLPTETELWEMLIADAQKSGCADVAVVAAVWLARAWYNKRSYDPTDAFIKEWLPQAHNAEIAHAEGLLMRWRGAILTAQGKFAQAADELQAVKALFDRADLTILANQCRIDIAWAGMNLGHHEAAVRDLEDVLAFFMHHQLPMRQASCLFNQSIANLELGRFARSFHQLLAARAKYTASGRTLEIGNCDLQLGRLYNAVGHWPAASAQFTQAMDRFTAAEAVGRLPSCLYQLALAHIGQGLYDQADQALLQAMAAIASEKEHQLHAFIALEQARILALRGHHASADARYRAIAANFERAEQMVAWARCGVERGFLALAQGQGAEASALFEASQPHLGQEASVAWRCVYGLARCAELAGDGTLARERYQNALAQVLAIRSQVVSEHLSSRLFAALEAFFTDAIAFACDYDDAAFAFAITETQRTMTLQRLLRTPLEAASRQPALARLRTEMDSLAEAAGGADPATLTALDELLQRYAQELWTGRYAIELPEQTVPAVELATVHERCSTLHGTNWTVVSYTLLGARLWITVVSTEAARCHAVPWRADMADLIRDLGDSEENPYFFQDIPLRQGMTTIPWEALAQLADYLLPPEVQARLDKDHRLYVIPSGSLHSLAWATLRVNGDWLVEQALVHMLPHAMFLDANLPAIKRSLLHVGCSEFGQPDLELPFVPAERAAIAELWSGDFVALQEAQSTVQRFRDPAFAEQLAGTGVLHLATHCMMHHRYGLAGYVLLHDGKLWVDEIAQLRLTQALVVMSTCSGAVVQAHAGDENISPTWSWLLAGASTVVAGLWPQYDQVLVELMQGFYTQLEDGCDVALALAETQRALIKRGYSPILWGGFVPVGYPMALLT